MKYLLIVMLLALSANLYNEIYLIKPDIIKPVLNSNINYADPNLMNDGRQPGGMAYAPNGSHRDWNVESFREE